MKMISIENLLTWAFTQELPKANGPDRGPAGHPSSTYAFDQVAALGCMVDGYGTPWDQIKIDVPHADAIAVSKAVGSLEHRAFDIADGWNPFPEWNDDHGLIAAEVSRIAYEQSARTSSGSHIVSLVISAAILRQGPDWAADEPKIVEVMRSGKPAWFVKRKCRNGLGNLVEYEDSGLDRRTGRPMKGAYRKYTLKHPIRGAVIGRMEWQLWQSALAELHSALSSVLSCHRLIPFRPAMQPWLTIPSSAHSRQDDEFTSQ